MENAFESRPAVRTCTRNVSRRAHRHKLAKAIYRNCIRRIRIFRDKRNKRTIYCLLGDMQTVLFFIKGHHRCALCARYLAFYFFYFLLYLFKFSLKLTLHCYYYTINFTIEVNIRTTVKICDDSRSRSKRCKRTDQRRKVYNKLRDFRKDFDTFEYRFNIPFLKVDSST